MKCIGGTRVVITAIKRVCYSVNKCISWPHACSVYGDCFDSYSSDFVQVRQSFVLQHFTSMLTHDHSPSFSLQRKSSVEQD